MKQKILNIILVILIILIIIVIFVVTLNKNNSFNKNETKYVIDELKDVSWVYFKSDFYNMNNELSEAIMNNCILNFYDTYLKMCFDDICLESEYDIDKNILTINSIDGFAGKNVVSFENENLFLEHYFKDGSRMIYYFEKAKG